MDTEQADEGASAVAPARAAIRAKVQENQAASRELAKDANQLSHQSRVLRDRAALARAEARRLRAGHAAPAPALSVTVPTACLHLGVCERTLRRVLLEPDIQERVLYHNRRNGIFYRYTLLLPPDLMDDLAVRFAEKKTF